MSDPTPLEGNDDFLREVKTHIQAAQVRAALAISRELILLYWRIGQEIRERQERFGWGAKVVARLADDLKTAFPVVDGFSRTNLLYMRSFAAAYPDAAFVQQLLDNYTLPWGHHLHSLDKVNSDNMKERKSRNSEPRYRGREVLSAKHRREE